VAGGTSHQRGGEARQHGGGGNRRLLVIGERGARPGQRKKEKSSRGWGNRARWAEKGECTQVPKDLKRRAQACLREKLEWGELQKIPPGTLNKKKGNEGQTLSAKKETENRSCRTGKGRQEEGSCQGGGPSG